MKGAIISIHYEIAISDHYIVAAQLNQQIVSHGPHSAFA